MSATTQPLDDDANAGTRAALLTKPTNSHLAVLGQSPYTSGTSSQSGSDISLHRVKNAPGYKTPVFSGKEKQRIIVEKDVASKVLQIRLTNFNTSSTFLTGIYSS